MKDYIKKNSSFFLLRFVFLTTPLIILSPAVFPHSISTSIQVVALRDDVTNSNTSTSNKIQVIELQEKELETDYIQTILIEHTPLTTIKSPFQTISIYNSPKYYKKVLVIDECLQLTERDASHYNEMLSHVPVMEYFHQHHHQSSTSQEMNKNSGISSTTSSGISTKLKILVLGGGDGYVVSELLKYDAIIDKIDHVELDENVVSLSEQYFPWAKNLWNHEKVNLKILNGAEYVNERAKKISSLMSENHDHSDINKSNNTIITDNSYHIIIQDSSDPFYTDEDGESIVTLPSSVLYTIEHLQNIYTMLEAYNGVLIFQAETYNIPSNIEAMMKWRKMLSNDIGFRFVRYGTIAIGSYPTGQIGFFVAHVLNDSNKKKNMEDINLESKSFEIHDGGSTRVIEPKKQVTSEAQQQEEIIVELDMNVLQTYFKLFLEGETLYYHPRIHRSAFDLPLWVESLVYEEK